MTPRDNSTPHNPTHTTQPNTHNPTPHNPIHTTPHRFATFPIFVWMIIQPCGNRRFGLSLLGTGASFFFRDIWALNLGGGTIVFLRPFLAWSPSHQKNQWSVEEGRDSWRCGKRQRMRTACCFSFVSFPNFVLISSESGHADSSLGGLSLAGRVEGIDLGVGRWDGRPDGKGGMLGSRMFACARAHRLRPRRPFVGLATEEVCWLVTLGSTLWSWLGSCSSHGMSTRRFVPDSWDDQSRESEIEICSQNVSVGVAATTAP